MQLEPSQGSALRAMAAKRVMRATVLMNFIRKTDRGFKIGVDTRRKQIGAW